MATNIIDAVDAVDATATDAEAEVEADPAHTYDIVERDTVPAPAPRADSSLQERIETLLQWLQPTDFLSPGNEFMKHLHSYVPGTGRWVHESGPFRAWAGLNENGPDATAASGEQHPPRCLHVRGVAGSGKSVFAASTVRQLQKSGRGQPNIVLFFFFRQIVDKNHTARYLVRDFAAQLLPHSAVLVAALTTLSQEHGVFENELDVVWPALVEALHKDEGIRGRVFCVIDALDEMDDGDFAGMVAKLVTLGTAEPAAARVMMTSRPLPYIEHALSHPGFGRLKLDPALLSPDVARYVDARMSTLQPPLSVDKRELVRQTICERANGLFLQARLMTDNLAEGLRDGRITPEALPDSLDRLPRTLRAVYEGMLKEHARRSGVTAEQQAKILMCVTHASRPLRLIELGSLLARLLHVDLRRGKDLVRAGCGRLLELLEDETVSVIHHSFTEFLHDPSRTDDQDAFPVLEDEESHAMLAELLLEYLDGCPRFDITIDDTRESNYEQHEFSNKERNRRDEIRTDTRINQPLVSYAVSNLSFHVSKVQPGGTAATRLLASLDRYLVQSRPAFETWVLMNWNGPLSASFSIFHLITSIRYKEPFPVYVLEHFAEREPALLDSRDAEGLTPLAYAAQRGHADLAEALLARGADPLSGEGEKDGYTPLHWAAKERRADVVRLLLKAGVDPLVKTWPVLESYNRYDDYYEEYTEEEAEENRETALSVAFRADDTEVVKTFMPFIPPDKINMCFHQVRAVENVRLLLETGKVNVDCFHGGVTKLFRAAQDRKPDLVKLLLEYGADPNKRSDADKLSDYGGKITMEIMHPQRDRGPTPLHAFAGVRHHRRVLFDHEEEDVVECFRLLIDAGADVNATMDDKPYFGENMTALHLAVKENKDSLWGFGSNDRAEEVITELLLSAGADPNAKTKCGNTPLHLANPEKLRVLELLVEHGADINTVNRQGRSPLLELIFQSRRFSSWDKVEPDVRVFSRLLDLGADVNITDDEGNTILHHIFSNMESFADPQFLPLVQKILAAGADPNKRNKKGEPPLWKYSPDSRNNSVNNHAHEDLLRMLIDAGLDLNARDGTGCTILWVIGKHYDTRLNTVERLVRLGADPGAVAQDGKTLLHFAVNDKKSPEWFRYFISAGARADTFDQDGETIIHALLRVPREDNVTPEVLQILIEAGASPLTRNAKGQSALHVVQSVDMLKIVLNTPSFSSLDVNEPDVDGLTPLHHAVALGEVAVHQLISAGADPTALAAGSLSPLHIAARDGNANVVGLLLARYHERNALMTHINLLGDGRAPLHYACRSGSPEAVWTLLDNGADAQIADKNGLTPLHALTEVETREMPRFVRCLPHVGDIIRMLQFAGVDLNAEAVVQTEDERTSRIMTPLDMAVERHCWAVARQLIAHGANPRDNHKQSEDFVLATDKRKAAEEARKAQAQTSSVQDASSRSRQWRGRWAACPGAKYQLHKDTYFIACGQDILDLKTQNGQGDSDASKNSDNSDEPNGADILRSVMQEDGDYDTVMEYAEIGGNMLELDQYNESTFLHDLAEQGYVELLEHLGTKVAELEAQEWVQQDEERAGTLLCTACERAKPSLHLIKLLVDKLGVDVNAVYNRRGYCYKLRGATALHILATGAHFWQVEALKFLLAKGADIEARNKDGMTPLLAAISTQHPEGFWREETVRVLLRHGADVNATMKGIDPTQRDISALELSSQPGVTKLLLENGARVENCPGILARVVGEWMEPEIVKLLLDAGLDPNELLTAQGKLRGVNQSGDDEAEHEHEEKTNVDVRYALHEAARPRTGYRRALDFESRQQAVIELLLSRGANPCAIYPDGRFVIQAIMEDRGVVNNILPRLSRVECNVKGHRGRTLLVSACIPLAPAADPLYSHSRNPNHPTVMIDTMHALLDAGADPYAADDEGRTPLHWFCTFRGQFSEAHRNAFVALIRRGPEAVQTPDKQGRKPVHLALATYAERAHHLPSMIQELLSAGADPADPDPITGNSALHFVSPRLVGEPAAAAAAAELFRSLASRLDINTRNAAGETPLFTFAAAGWEGTRDPTGKISHPQYAVEQDVTHAAALERVFAGLGADMLAVDARGRTLLHVTAGRELPKSNSDWDQRDDVVSAFKKLMELGVDPRREDDELRTAIDVAIARNLYGIVELFSEKGKKMHRERGGE
ncbi:ankyrin repeat-containing domain protein [Corynascus novoguineensis]|uniref:Ankyrin repeat-containing domain protein n=1 Tax=Corynascus novoguineensis TaxID=1126955 RepID=A0AAN7HLS3_9PEZI|nr:ankyrin repeat-containing domain protein [Corynascus novoguineensis]